MAAATRFAPPILHLPSPPLATALLDTTHGTDEPGASDGASHHHNSPFDVNVDH